MLNQIHGAKLQTALLYRTCSKKPLNDGAANVKIEHLNIKNLNYLLKAPV